MEWPVAATLLCVPLVAAPWLATKLQGTPGRMRADVQRYVSLVVGVLLMLCGGTPYMVSMFGQAFELRFELSESDTILVETCAHVGLYLGLSQGLFYDHFGEKWACLFAGLLLAIGYTGVR